MREILFRGKRLDNGEWMESGSIVRCSDDGVVWDYYLGTGKPATHEIDEHKNIVASVTYAECLFALIDPETVGQYTGLRDKNGKKIFEGDILECSYGIRYIIFEKGSFCAKKFNSTLCAAMKSLVDELKHNYEVIGNIHDNPEFLKGGAK